MKLPRGRRSLIVGTAALIAAAIATSGAALRIVDRSLVRPPTGIEDPESLFRVRLVELGREGATSTRDVFAASELSALAGPNSGIDVAAFSKDVSNIRLAGTSADTAVRFRIAYVNKEYGRLLGARLLMGSWSDTAVESGVVLNYSTWMRFGGADVAPPGSPIHVGGEWRVLTGVTADGFTGTEPAPIDAWIPVAIEQVFANGGYALRALIRGRATEARGMAPRELQARVESALLGNREFGRPNESVTDRAELRALSKGPWRGTGSISGTQWSLVVLVGALALMNLLVAGASAAALWLLRLVRERKVLEIQIALGASAWRVTRRELGPMAYAATSGVLAGVLLSVVVERLIVARVQMEGVATAIWSSRDTLVTAAATAIVVLLAVAVPAVRAWVLALAATRGARLVGQNRPQRWLRILVGAQASVAFVVVAMGLLLAKSVREGTSDRIGFAPDGLLWVDLRDKSSATDALALVRAAPAVKAAALSSSLAMSSVTMIPVRSPELSQPTVLTTGGPYVTVVSPGYFSTVRPPKLRGRDFAESDAAGTELVAIVGETMARLLWRGRDAIGECLNASVRSGDTQTFMCHRVIGVVADMPSLALRDAAPMQFYVTMAQRSDLGAPGFMLVREEGKGDTPAMIRAALTRPGLDHAGVRMGRVSDLLEREIRPLRLGATLAGVTAAFVVALAAIGLFGVSAYSVEQRRREFAIRFAVGASPSRISRIVLAESAVILAVASVVGAALVLFSTSLLRDLTYHVSVRDPMAMGGALLVIVIGVTAATLVPASRAGQVDIRRMLG